jgi:hypothetical protein
MGNLCLVMSHDVPCLRSDGWQACPQVLLQCLKLWPALVLHRVHSREASLTQIWCGERKECLSHLFCDDGILLPEGQPPDWTKGQYIPDVADSYFSSHDLSWKSCISICTGGAPSMSGILKWFVTLAKQKNTGIVFTHCFLQREASYFKIINAWGPKSIGWEHQSG